MKIPNMELGKLVDEKGFLMPAWRTVFSQLFTELQQKASEEGLALPKQTTANIATISSGSTEPFMWYDTITNQFKVNINGTVKIVQVV